MKREINEPLEMAFAEEVFKGLGFYNINNNHRMFSKIEKAPAHRFDLRSILWKIEFPDDDLAQRIETDLYDDFQMIELDNFKEEHGFEIFFDMNGYRILADIPVHELLEKKEEYLNDFYNLSLTEIEDLEILKDEIESINTKLLKCARQIMIFDGWVKRTKKYFDSWFDDRIFITDGEIFDFVSKDDFEVEYEERIKDGWRKWDDVKVEQEYEETFIKKHSDKSIIKIIKQTGKGILEGISLSWIKYAKGSMED